MMVRKNLSSFNRITALIKNHTVWIFPAVLLIALLTLTALKISGSSIGVYSLINGSADTSAVTGSPRGVRSDEWLVTTQLTIAQANNDFQKVNENIAGGQNMALLDVPYLDWSTAFKPQNLIFFMLPLEYAFAFKWWLLLAILMLACYFLALELFPKKILRAALLSICIGLSPMIFWWWTSGTLLTIGYSILIALFTIRLLKAASTKQRLVYGSLLTYVFISFALLLYPPFQIPCLIAAVIFIVGWFLEQYRTKSERIQVLATSWVYFLAILAVSVIVGLAFYQTNKDVITATTHTVYPGARVVSSGGTEPLLTFSSFLSPNLQYDTKAAEGYLGNQSEASNFIFIAPFLFLPSLYVIIQEKRKNKRMLWGLLLINVLLAIFLARMYIATPWLEPFYRLFLLDKVPNVRLLIGLGLTGFFQLLLFMKALDKTNFKKAELYSMAAVGSLSSLGVMLYIGDYTIDHFPVFIASFAKASLFALWVAAGIFLIIQKRFIFGLILLITFSAASVYHIHPLYQGLGSVTNSSLFKTIQSYPDDDGWVVLDDRLLINFPLMAGKESLTGIHFAPQIELWKELDAGKQYNEVYNRYAHVLFVTDDKMTKPLALKHADMFTVKFNPCGDFLQKHATHVVSTKELSGSCVHLDKTVSTPAKQFFIYTITPPLH